MMHLTALLLLAAEGEGPTSPFQVEPGLAIWTWVVFIAVFLLLRKYAWPAIVSATEEREKRIRDQLAEAERMNAEAKTSAEAAAQAAAEARSGAQALLAEARQAAEKERAALLEKAKGEQEELLARARREITAEKERAMAELRAEAVDLSLAAATRLIEQRLDQEGDRKLVTDYLSTLGTVH